MNTKYRFSLIGWAVVCLMIVCGPGSATVAKALSNGDAHTINNGLLQYATGGHVIGFEETGVYAAAGTHVLRIGFVGTPGVMPQSAAGAGESDRVQPLGAVRYPDLWPGITLTYTPAGNSVFESTYYVAPRAEVNAIRLAYNVPVETEENGALNLRFKAGTMTESAPVAWQKIDGQKKPVQVAFRITGTYEAGFEVGTYDPALPLIIDPVLEWNTFLGSASDDDWLYSVSTTSGNYIAVDDAGNVYVAGDSYAAWGHPIRPFGGIKDAFVAKLDSNGNLLWNTFLGSDAFDTADALAVDGSGNVFVTGTSAATWGTPVRPYAGGTYDAFVVKLDGCGAILWNTFLGSGASDAAGLDRARSIAKDGSGNVYVAGTSFSNWGTPVNAKVGSWYYGVDTFVAKLNGSGVLQWHTFMGELEDDICNSIAVDGSGNVYVAGSSDVSTWGSPVMTGDGADDGFVAKLNSSGALIWNSFLGDFAQGVAAGESGNVYVVGISGPWGTPIRPYTPEYDDGFVAKLNSAGELVWNTFLGGWSGDAAYAVVTDDQENLYVAGSTITDSWGTPVNPLAGTYDAFAAKLSKDGVLLWNTFMGSALTGVLYPDVGRGIAVSATGDVYVAGESDSTWGAPVNAYAGEKDVFVAKLRPELVIDSRHGSVGHDVTYTISVTSARNTVGAFGLDIAFDGSRLAYQGFARGALTTDFEAVNANIVSPGLLRIGGYTSDNQIQVGDGGPLVTVTFRNEACLGSKLIIQNKVDDIGKWSSNYGLNTCNDDMDGDGIPDVTDNCPGVYNDAQADSDNDGVGDACECVSTNAPEEICGDGIDNDSDGLVDEGCQPWYRDGDGDGYGDPAQSVSAMAQPAGYVSDKTDCNDARASIHPGAVEICGNDLDEDCSGEDLACVGNTVFYVDKDAAGANNGTSWQDAFVHLQDALAAFTDNPGYGNEIWVAAGSYYPDEGIGRTNDDRASVFGSPTVWPNNTDRRLSLYGGFDGTDGAGGGALERDRDQRDPETNVTILSGDLAQNDVGFSNNQENAYHVIGIIDTPWIWLIDGFTITAGNANDPDWCHNDNGWGDGGGITFTTNLSSSKLSVYNCTITMNHAIAGGGGVFIDSNNHAIRFYNCVIDGNTADGAGGGIYDNGGKNTEIDKCAIINNNGGGGGGGMFNNLGAFPRLTDCIFSGNSALKGGAIANNGYFLGEASPILINCIFSGNSADNGGAMYNNGDLGATNPSLSNCTLSGNKANLHGNEIYNHVRTVLSVGECHPQLTNCIVWNDAPIYNDSPVTATYAYCNIKGCGGSASWLASLGMDLGGNIDADPMFVDPPDPADAPTTSGDVHLQDGSPSIDTGTATGAPTADFEGDTRDAAPDMGADEYLPDTDGDGEPDITDGCPNDPVKTAPGACGCGWADTDSDGDGTPDCNDGCPNDPNKVFAGVCGCGVADTDSDGDGTPDCNDGCPADPLKTTPGQCGCGIVDSDNCGGVNNLPPVADAGEDRIVSRNTTVALDGSGSADPDDGIAAYLWAQTGGPAVSLSDPAAVGPSFTVPDAVGETLTFQLTVTDTFGAGDSDDVVLVISEEGCNTRPDQPVLIAPEDGASGVSLTPTLTTAGYHDPGDCSTHFKTRWQISEQTDFSGLTYNANTFYDALTAHRVTKKVLKPRTTYYWRVYYQGDHGVRSEWSEVFSFTTGSCGSCGRDGKCCDRDGNANGLPDDLEVGADTDVNGNGIPDSQEGNLRVLMTADGGGNIGLAFGADVLSIDMETLDGDEFDELPGNFPYGLMAFRVAIANPGATVSFTVYLPEAAPDNAVWYKYDTVNGWYDFTGQITFSPDRKAVTFQLTDGGTGDADGAVNGTIVDPAGLATAAGSSGHGGGGSSCFIGTCAF